MADLDAILNSALSQFESAQDANDNEMTSQPEANNESERGTKRRDSVNEVDLIDASMIDDVFNEIDENENKLNQNK